MFFFVSRTFLKFLNYIKLRYLKDQKARLSEFSDFDQSFLVQNREVSLTQKALRTENFWDHMTILRRVTIAA